MSTTPPQGLPDDHDQTVIAAFVLRDEQGRVWVAPVPENDRPGGVMPHLLPGDDVRVTPGEPEKGLEVEQITVKGRHAKEFDLLLDAVALPETLSAWVLAQVNGPSTGRLT